MNDLMRRAFVWMLVYTPSLAAVAQQGLPAGLDGKPRQVLTGLQTFFLFAGGILVTISLIGCGIAMAFYRRKWEDIAAPVMGGVVIGSATALGTWLTTA